MERAEKLTARKEPSSCGGRTLGARSAESQPVSLARKGNLCTSWGDSTGMGDFNRASRPITKSFSRHTRKHRTRFLEVSARQETTVSSMETTIHEKIPARPDAAIDTCPRAPSEKLAYCRKLRRGNAGLDSRGPKLAVGKRCQKVSKIFLSPAPFR
jgi:hypothetical protein